MQLKHHVELLMSYDRAIIVYENNCESTLDMNDEDDLNISETEKQAKENLIRIKKEFGLESERLDNEIFRATKLRNVGLRHQLIKMSVMKAESARAQLNSMKSALQSVRKQISFRPSCTPITKIGDLMLRDIRTCSFSVDGSGNAISGGINNKSIYTSPETTLGLYPEYTGLSAISLADTLSGNTSTCTHSKSPCISNSNTTQPTLIISTPEFSPTSFGKDDTKPPPHYSTPAFYMDKISFTRKDDLELTMGLVNSDLLSRDVLISRNAKSPSQTHPSSRYPPRNFLPSKKTVSDYSPDNTRHYLSKPLAHASTSTSISPSPSTPSSGRAHHKANEMHSSYKSRSTDSSLYNGSSKMGLSATTVRTRSAAPITKAHNNANRSFGSIVGLDLYVPRIDPGSELNSSSQNISYFRPGSYSNDCANADLRRSLAKVAEDESFGHFYGHRSHNHPTPRMKNQPFKIYAQNTFTSSPPPAHGRFETCVTSNIANHTNNMKKSSDFVDTPLFVNEGTSSKAIDPQTPSTISPSSSLCVPGERATKDIFSSFSHQSTVSPQETAENDSTIAYNVGCAKSFSFPCDDPATDTSELHKKYTYETDSYHRSAKLYSSSETFVGDHV
ncbi:hypothetical protein AX774_g5456 [Zancudomyces culisetae]|uniref:Uncharacterized protein n=1 Tax=Zancudomyces culisetae TaxID=1213189 RepID=A0A1R1PJI3_ZANCU|nr:hypothetical protein AX774_g5456 [Zancudomyces culisetae]|eukprot:OMH81093.1 hypothetical protein AX774_g5456 [Zancudomyces culisetae]